LRAAAIAVAIAILSIRVGISQTPASVQFVNASAQGGITFQHVNGASPDRHLYEIMSGGGLFFDYDNDGWLDVFLVDGGSLSNAAIDKTAQHRLYRNRGNGTFQDVSASSGITHAGYGMGACAADVNNDGWIDLYVTSVGTNALYQNNAGKGFTDVTKAAGVSGAPMFSASCAFADVDRDGDVDLFLVHYVDARVDNNTFCGDVGRKYRIYCHPLTFAALRNTLYRNNGSGVFTDVSKETGILDHRGNGLGVVFGDYDDDGWVDAFVANDSTPNFLFHNEAGRRFSETALLAGVSVASDGMPRAGMGTDFGDYDGDGDLDLFVSNHELEAHTLFRNLGKGLFEDATFPSGVGPATLPYVGFGSTFVDYDNDGDLDLGIVNGHVMNSPGHVRPGATEAQRKLLLRNSGGGRLSDVGRQSGPGFASEKVGRTLVAGDIDNDGDLDLLVTNNGGNAELLRNEGGTGNNAVLIQLVGTKSNRSAVGARVRLTAGGTTQVREVKAGSSYLGQNDLRVHAGLGKSAKIDRLDVRWPNGQNEVIDGAVVNQILTVTEGKGITARTPFVRK
jgi:enediyne biosynthesis protein E4